MKRQNFYEVEQGFRNALACAEWLSEGDWDVHILINPSAGGFNSSGLRGYFRRRPPRGISSLLESGQKAAENHRQVTNPADVSLFLHLSAYPGHAGRTAAAAARMSLHDKSHKLIISLGGDGTHWEILNALSEVHDSHPDARFTAFRFPLGSGNDAADAVDAPAAWEALISGQSFQESGYLQVETASGARHRAFNIASIGIDAHIVNMTNLLKDRLPGDFYKIATDLSVPFYPYIYHVSEAQVTAIDDSGETTVHNFPLGLLAFGVSGRRRYGNGLWILPDDHQVCAIHLANLAENLKMKRFLYQARHGELPFVRLMNFRSMEVSYNGAIPMELDGEVVHLMKEDFPLKITRVDAHIPVLRGVVPKPD